MARLGAVEQVVDADHVEGELRRLKADHFAIARKRSPRSFTPVGVARRDVHGAHGFFFAAAAGAGDAGDADAEGAADAAANAFGERDGYFRADRAF